MATKATLPKVITPGHNYILRVTLCKTENPKVTRTISVPSSLNFTELHLTIAAAFGWDWTSDVCTTWIFRIWNENPADKCDYLRNKGKTAAFYDAPDSESGLQPKSLRIEATIGLLFRQQGQGQYWTYEYNLSRLFHAIEVVGTSSIGEAGRIVGRGGEGSIKWREWQFADMGNVEGVTVGKSNYDFDMSHVNTRLSVVQDLFETRKKTQPKLKNEKAAATPAPQKAKTGKTLAKIQGGKQAPKAKSSAVKTVGNKAASSTTSATTKRIRKPKDPATAPSTKRVKVMKIEEIKDEDDEESELDIGISSIIASCAPKKVGPYQNK